MNAAILLIRYSIFALILGMLGCTPSPEETVMPRIKLAKAEDALAQCRLLAMEHSFQKDHDFCNNFQQKDQDCTIFPEKKEGCIKFIRSSDYAQQKSHCIDFIHEERNCADLVDTRIPNWIYEIASWVGFDWKKKTWVEWVLAMAPEIHIGIIWSGYGGDSFIQGLNLGRDEINQKGGVLGRTFKTHLFITHGDLNKSRKIAEKISADTRIRAVIGRQFSSNLIPVTYIYEKSNIVYLAVSATNKNVIRYGMNFIFRQLPNNDAYSNALVQYCKLKKFENVALLYSRDTLSNSYSEEVAYAFRDYAVENKINIVYEKSFFKDQDNFTDISADIQELLPNHIDAIFLSTLSSTAVKLINGLRDMGITVPLIGTDSLDSSSFAQEIGAKGNGLIVPTVYNPYSKHSANAQFVNLFREKYGVTPDTMAAQAYDAIHLLAHAIDNEANSTVPAQIASGIRYMKQYIGTTGTYVYQKSGELAFKAVFFKELQYEDFIMFRDTKLEEEQSQQIEIKDDFIVYRPNKPIESTNAMSILMP